jgi:hypothetical protein
VRRVCAAASILVVGSVLAGCSTSTALPISTSTSQGPHVGGTSGQALALAAVADALAQPSLHYVATSTATNTPNGNVQVTIVGDVGQTEGIQEITWQNGGSDGHANVEVIGGAAYFRADSESMLQRYFGFGSKAASENVGRWIEVTAADGAAFQSVSGALTVKPVVAELATSGPYSSPSTTTVSGVTARQVSAYAPAASTGGVRTAVTLTMTMAEQPLPIGESDRGDSGGTAFASTLTISGWGEPVRVVAPPTSVPYATAIGGTATE